MRELENCIESAVVLSEGEILGDHLPLPVGGRRELPAIAQQIPAGFKPTDTLPMTLDQMEKAHVTSVLERAKGNRTQAAKWLGIGRNTLGRKLKGWGLSDVDE